MKRYFVVQRCDDRSGWEDCPELPPFDKEHEAIRSMETYNPIGSRVYALRVQRKPKGWVKKV
jgi:hypothetical protein